jgi:hypothetical protein
MTSLLNFIKIYQLVRKLLRGTHRRTDRQTGDLISLTFLFKESRLRTGPNTVSYEHICCHGKINSSKVCYIPDTVAGNNNQILISAGLNGMKSLLLLLRASLSLGVLLDRS